MFEIEQGTLQEFNRFHDNLNVRNRCYQLYLIIEYATQYLKIPFSHKEEIVFYSLHSLKKSPIKHYYTSKNYIDSTVEEQEFYNIIKNRIQKIHEAVINNQTQASNLIRCKPYNNEGVIEHRVPQELYENFTNYIIYSYNNFV